MSKKAKPSIAERLDDLIADKVPCIMQDIMGDTETPVETRASRVYLLNTALHHLKLLRGGYE